MLNNTFKETSQKVTEGELLDVEKKFAFTFPEELKKLYLQYNGGEPEKYIFIDDEGIEFVIQKVLPIKYSNKGIDTLEKYIEDFREDGILPEWLIPFAYDPGGDLFCFSINIEDNGSIYYWSHEYDLDEDPEDYVIKLSQSMNNFISNLSK